MNTHRSHLLAKTAGGLALLAILFVPLSARIVVIGAPQGTPREDLRAAAHKVIRNPSEAEALRAKGFEVKVSEGNVLSTDLSPNPNGVAYIYSDAAVTMGSGFKAPQGTTFGNSVVASPKTKAPLVSKTFSTALTHAAVNSKGLSIAYTVAEPGPVTVRAYGPSGKTLGSWRWHESQAGARERALELRADALRGGPVWIRWSQGRVSAVRRVVQAEGK